MSSPELPRGASPDSPEPLPVRMLNEFVYCPRLFYYEHVEGVFQHNADTKRGAALHKRVDAGKGELPAASPASADESQVSNLKSEIPAAAPPEPEVIHSRSVSLSSDRLGVTAKTIHRLFAKETGMTFGQWRQQARLLFALERLARGERIIDVAIDSGYASQSAFTAMFRKHFGMPPSAFYR